MKINFPSTQDGWIKLGKLIVAKSENLNGEAPINPADASPKKIGELGEISEKHLANSIQLHKDAEAATEQGNKTLLAMQDEIRRIARVLTGRYRNNLKQLGVWGFIIDESSPTEPPPVPPSI